jgi:hypothetical protein
MEPMLTISLGSWVLEPLVAYMLLTLMKIQPGLTLTTKMTLKQKPGGDGKIKLITMLLSKWMRTNTKRS